MLSHVCFSMAFRIDHRNSNDIGLICRTILNKCQEPLQEVRKTNDGKDENGNRVRVF